MNCKLQNKIENFLSEKREAKCGGWAEITPKDIEDLREIINLLIFEKCEKDCDGDLPVEFELVNRRTHERYNFFQIPYWGVSSKVEDTPEHLDSVQQTLLYNLSIANERLQNFFKCMQYRKSK